MCVWSMPRQQRMPRIKKKMEKRKETSTYTRTLVHAYNDFEMCLQTAVYTGIGISGKCSSCGFIGQNEWRPRNKMKLGIFCDVNFSTKSYFPNWRQRKTPSNRLVRIFFAIFLVRARLLHFFFPKRCSTFDNTKAMLAGNFIDSSRASDATNAKYMTWRKRTHTKMD